ncbi:Coiled-coil domain-containing protein 86 [Armadillidium vulgare]|nr:Coiled-coil domain-containing protein 86 [Armadillidium vulgare]
MISDTISKNIDNHNTESVDQTKELESMDVNSCSDDAKSQQKSGSDKKIGKNIDNVLIPKGQYKSGRFWKSERKRFSSVIKVKPLKKPLSKKQILKKEREVVLKLSSEIKAEKQRRKEELRERQKLNKEKRLENERKGEVVQVIKNTKKLKKMSRKQLKYIETRDTTAINKSS